MTAKNKAWRGEAKKAFFLLALILTAFSASVVITGCSSSTPEIAVREFVNARIEGNESRATELTVEGNLRGYLGGEPFLAFSGAEFTTELVESERDRAVVRAHFSWDEGSVDVTYVCRLVKSRWKVSLRETEGLWYPEGAM